MKLEFYYKSTKGKKDQEANTATVGDFKDLYKRLPIAEITSMEEARIAVLEINRAISAISGDAKKVMNQSRESNMDAAISSFEIRQMQEAAKILSGFIDRGSVDGFNFFLQETVSRGLKINADKDMT